MGESCIDGCFCWVESDEHEDTETWRPCPPSLCEKADHSKETPMWSTGWGFMKKKGSNG